MRTGMLLILGVILGAAGVAFMIAENESQQRGASDAPSPSAMHTEGAGGRSALRLRGRRPQHRTDIPDIEAGLPSGVELHDPNPSRIAIIKNPQLRRGTIRTLYNRDVRELVLVPALEAVIEENRGRYDSTAAQAMVVVMRTEQSRRYLAELAKGLARRFGAKLGFANLPNRVDPHTGAAIFHAYVQAFAEETPQDLALALEGAGDALANEPTAGRALVESRLGSLRGRSLLPWFALARYLRPVPVAAGEAWRSLWAASTVAERGELLIEAMRGAPDSAMRAAVDAVGDLGRLGQPATRWTDRMLRLLDTCVSSGPPEGAFAAATVLGETAGQDPRVRERLFLLLDVHSQGIRARPPRWRPTALLLVRAALQGLAGVEKPTVEQYRLIASLSARRVPRLEGLRHHGYVFMTLAHRILGKPTWEAVRVAADIKLSMKPRVAEPVWR